MLWTIVVILIVLWLLGSIGAPRFGWYGERRSAPGLIHIIIVVAVLLLLWQLFGSSFR
jgi:hypothetical protein